MITDQNYINVRLGSNIFNEKPNIISGKRGLLSRYLHVVSLRRFISKKNYYPTDKKQENQKKIVQVLSEPDRTRLLLIPFHNDRYPIREQFGHVANL